MLDPGARKAPAVTGPVCLSGPDILTNQSEVFQWPREKNMLRTMGSRTGVASSTQGSARAGLTGKERTSKYLEDEQVDAHQAYLGQT